LQHKNTTGSMEKIYEYKEYTVYHKRRSYPVEDLYINRQDITVIHNYTNSMLGDKMDEPFFRYSMFDNYIIKEED